MLMFLLFVEGEIDSGIVRGAETYARAIETLCPQSPTRVECRSLGLKCFDTLGHFGQRLSMPPAVHCGGYVKCGEKITPNFEKYFMHMHTVLGFGPFYYL